jgi:hypothetical protein
VAPKHRYLESMTPHGQYADGRAYELPVDWLPLSESVLQRALQLAREAVTNDSAFDRLTRFYNRDSEYAGTSFLDVEPKEAGKVTASDLHAVSRLSMSITNLQSRRLLDEREVVEKTDQLLADLSPDLAITDLEPPVLDSMWLLYNHFRSLLATPERLSNHWVFAAKLCARKRPYLFPVRDSVVCRYLSGWRRLAGSSADAQGGRLGWFTSDIQVFAHLASDEMLRRSLADHRSQAAERNLKLDDPPLRLLDVLLWTEGKLRETGGLPSPTTADIT